MVDDKKEKRKKQQFSQTKLVLKEDHSDFSSPSGIKHINKITL